MIQKLLNSIKRILFKKDSALFLEKLKSETVKFKTVFDIGAFHGKFTDEILQFNPNIKMHCFEPSNESCKILENKYKQKVNITINHKAVSDFSGSAVLNVNAFNETNSLLESATINESINELTKKQSSEEVQVIRLQDYCLQHCINEIDLIKIDTQGNSYNVLLGMEPLLKEKKVKYLYVEAEFVEIYKNEKLFSEIEILMREYGYGIVDIYNMNYLDNERLAWCDVLFKVK